jgi:hypothetical protein
MNARLVFDWTEFGALRMARPDRSILHFELKFSSRVQAPRAGFASRQQ